MYVDQGCGPQEKLGPRGGRAGRELRGTYPDPDPQGPGKGELKSCSFNLLALQEDQAIKRELVLIKPPRFPRRKMQLGDCWFSALDSERESGEMLILNFSYTLPASGC